MCRRVGRNISRAHATGRRAHIYTLAEEQRRIQDHRQIDEQHRAEGRRRVDEQHRVEDHRQVEDHRPAEVHRRADEQHRVEERCPCPRRACAAGVERPRIAGRHGVADIAAKPVADEEVSPREGRTSRLCCHPSSHRGWSCRGAPATGRARVRQNVQRGRGFDGQPVAVPAVEYHPAPQIAPPRHCGARGVAQPLLEESLLRRRPDLGRLPAPHGPGCGHPCPVWHRPLHANGER